VEAIVTVVEAAAAMPPVMPGQSEHPIHGAYRAANTGADRATHDGTDRTCGAVAFTRAFLRTANNALRMAGMGDRRQQSQRDGRRREAEVQGKTRRWRQRRSPALRGSALDHIHLNSPFAVAPPGVSHIDNTNRAKRLRRHNDITTEADTALAKK
jgi:hypothetical protein